MKYLLLRYSLLWIKQITKKKVDVKLTVKSGRKGPVKRKIGIKKIGYFINNSERILINKL